jgi:hypothetical protein
MKNNSITANTVTSNNSNNLEYNELKLSFTSGVISHINSQLCGSFSDFYGFLIGRYKLIKNTNTNDSNANYQQNILSLTVDNVIFIFDKIYLKDKLDKLLDKMKKYTLIGVFSARKYSYPNISLKEQEFYLRNINLLKDKRINGLPLLFGSFCHNVTDESNDNIVKTINFYSRVYNYSDKLKEFISLPYEVINIKETTYANSVNLYSNKVIESNDTKDTDEVVNKLKAKVNEQVNLIENKLQKELKNLKMQLNVEIGENKKLYEKLKSFEN